MTMEVNELIKQLIEMRDLILSTGNNLGDEIYVNLTIEKHRKVDIDKGIFECHSHPEDEIELRYLVQEDIDHVRRNFITIKSRGNK